MTAATYGRVVLNTTVTLLGTTNIDGPLTFSTQSSNSGRLIFNGKTLQLRSTSSNIVGNSSFVGDSQANLQLSNGAAGNNGTLNFVTGGQVLHDLSLSFTDVSREIALGSDLTISNGGDGAGLGHFNGVFDLNGHRLIIDASSEFLTPISSSDGMFRGSSTSELHINSSVWFGAFPGEILMDQSGGDANHLAVLALNNPMAQLVVSIPLVVEDSLSVLDGSFDAGNGQVTIESNSSRRGRISRLTNGSGAGFINGDVRVRTFISGGATGWMFLGAPGVTGNTIKAWDTYSSSAGANGVPMTCTGCDYAPTVISPSFQSIQGWDENSDSYTLPNASAAIDPGIGFWVYVGDGASTTGDLSVLNTGPVIQTSGFPGTIPVVATGTNSDHWNLIANPFTSPITWSKFFAFGSNSSLVNGDIQIFSPDDGYQSCNSAGVCTGLLTNTLPIGQGFYVSATNSGNLTFDETIKVHDNTTDLYKQSAEGSKEFSLLRLNLLGTWDSDQTILGFDNRASKEYDTRYDAHKMFTSAGYQGYGNSYSKYTTISTKDATDFDYSINMMPLLTQSVSIPVLARVMVGGSHTITLSRENYGGCAILYDRQEMKYHDFSNGAYVCDIADTTSAPRFELMLCRTESEPVLSVQELNENHNIEIGQDRNGAFVQTSFETPTRAVISVFNIVGQQLMKDVVVEGTSTMTQLPLNVSNQVVIIRVTTDKETKVKKIIAH